MVPGKVEFEYLIAGALHAQLFIRTAGAGVVRVHVKANAGNILSGERQFLKVLEQPSKNPLITKFGPYVNALQPPKVTVAPITPLVGNHDLADDGTLNFCYKIEPLGWVSEYRVDTGP